jgi:aspartyl-tRNA synthetase
VTRANLDTRLDWRVLDLRTKESTAIFKIQAKVVEGMEDYLKKNGHLQVFTPCLIGGASEGGADVFPVVYFEKEAFLRQDPQLHRQLLIASGYDKIFDLGPSWRSEPSHTTRHLCEHRGCAVEEGFIKDEIDTMRIEEKLIIAVLKKIKKECGGELELFNKKIKIPKTPFPEIRFPKLYDILEKLGKKIPHGEDLDRKAEILLARHIEKKYKSDFFFINRFPFKAKPFYVMRVDENPEWARSVDLIFKGIEQSSGGQREHRYEKIIQQVKEKRMSMKRMEWFTKFFKYGVPPHGGFNLGIERFVMALLDLKNIREAVLFPRVPERFLP